MKLIIGSLVMVFLSAGYAQTVEHKSIVGIFAANEDCVETGYSLVTKSNGTVCLGFHSGSLTEKDLILGNEYALAGYETEDGFFVTEFSDQSPNESGYEFECQTASINSDNTISKLILTEDGAVLDGVFLDAGDVEAFRKRNISSTKNIYINGKEALILKATVVKVHVKQSRNSSTVSNIELLVSINLSNPKKYLGTCAEVNKL